MDGAGCGLGGEVVFPRFKDAGEGLKIHTAGYYGSGFEWGFADLYVVGGGAV